MKHTKRWLCAMLMLLLLSTPLASLAAGEVDPFDIGPIEPFEDTPDWAEETSKQPQYEPGMPLHVLVTDGLVHASFNADAAGSVEMDFMLELHMQKADMSPLATGHYRGTMALSADGEVKLKGVSKAIKMAAPVVVDFPDAPFEIDMNPIDPREDAMIRRARAYEMESYEAAYGKRPPDALVNRDFAYAVGKTTLQMASTGQVDITIITPDAKRVDQSAGGEADGNVELRVAFYESGKVQAAPVVAGKALFSFYGYIQDDAEYMRITAPSGRW